MTRPPRNTAASVHARLLHRSRETGEDFQYLLHRYAAERFPYRLGESVYREQYVLKGAMLFALWGGSAYRPTRDLDFTGFGSSDADHVLAAFREICEVSVPDDGLIFDATTLSAEPIREDTEYGGLRIRFRARLGTARIDMQVDLGFGNAIQPQACDVDYPVLLDGPVPNIRAYPHEAVVAEKLHALVMFGERTSRMKDLYDLYTLATQFPFDGPNLARAIAATFERRHTPIEAVLPAALTPRFFADGARAEQWRAYLRRNRLPGAPADFGLVGERVQSFLRPVWDAIARGEAFDLQWPTGGPWGEAR